MNDLKQPSPSMGRNYWQSHVNAFTEGNYRNKRDYCRQNKVSYDNFLYWFRRLNGDPKPSKLLPVMLHPSANIQTHCILELSGGHRLQIQSDVALSQLPDLLLRLSS